MTRGWLLLVVPALALAALGAHGVRPPEPPEPRAVLAAAAEGSRRTGRSPVPDGVPTAEKRGVPQVRDRSEVHGLPVRVTVWTSQCGRSYRTYPELETLTPEVLLACLDCEDEHLRWLVGVYLAGLEGPEDIERIRALLAGLMRFVRDGRHWDDIQGRRVATAIGRGGSDAQIQPLLDQLLCGATPELRKRAAWVLGVLLPGVPDRFHPVEPLRRILHDPREDVRFHGVNLLWTRGRETLPEIVAATRDRSARVRETAIWSLDCGADPANVLPALLVALHDEDPDVRMAAASSLPDIGAPPDAIVPALRAALLDPESSVRVEAADALGTIGPGATAAIPDLVALLASPDEDARYAAADALGCIGDPGALEPLARALLDPDDCVRTAAACALGRLGPAARREIPRILRADLDAEDRIEALRCVGGDRAVRALAVEVRRGGEASEDAVRALGRLGPGARAAVPTLVRALESEEEDLALAMARIGGPAAAMAVIAELHDDRLSRAVVLAALAILGSEAHGAVPALADLLREERNDDAAAALGRIGGAEATAVLIATLSSDDMELRAWSAAALGAPGLDPAEAVPALVGALTDDEWTVRVEAAKSLGQHGARAVASIEPLIAVLSDQNEEDDDVREAAALALGRIGPAAAAAVPALREIARRSGDTDPEEAVRALGRIGAGDAATVSVLVGVLRTGAPSLAEAAAWALGRLGPAARRAVPALRAALEASDGDPVYSRALAEIGPAARTAIPALRRVLDGGTFEVDAACALHRLGDDGPRVLAVLRSGLTNGYAEEWLRAGLERGPALRVLARALADVNDDCGPRGAAENSALLDLVADLGPLAADPAVEEELFRISRSLDFGRHVEALLALRRVRRE